MIEAFNTFLQERNYSIYTIASYTANCKKLLLWLDKEQINPQQASYQDLLAWTQSLKQKGLRPVTINQYLRIAKLFFDQLIETGQLHNNPAEQIRIKGHIRKVPHNLLKQETLIQLYEQHRAVGLIGKRNKVMLGFIIYQGIGTGELSSLKVEDIKFKEGKVFIPQVGRSNERTLELNAAQIIDLQAYIHQIRPQILVETGKQSEALFISKGKGTKLHNSINYLIKQVRAINPRVRDIKQLRASVISQWLEKYPIRKVQHLAGHRFVSSTERYQTDSLKSLQEQVEKLHPLG